MRKRSLSALVSVLALGLLLGGCGGDGGEGSAGEPAVSADPTGTTEPTGSGGVTRLGEPELTAEPGTAWADVDGGRLTFESAGSFAYLCDLGPDRVQVNFQTNEGRDLSLQAALQGDRWVGRLTFQPGGGQNLQYGATLPDAADPLVIGESAVSFEGTVSRVEEFDLANATDVEASVAVSCALDGDGELPTAVVDGTTYTFSPSGAQSFDCAVTDSEIEARINRLSRDGLQLEVNARREGDAWIGAVTVITPEGTFTSTVPQDGSGLTVDGSSVAYEGTFGGGPGGDVDGTVSVTCP